MDNEEFFNELKVLLKDERIKKMKMFSQHGGTSTYYHVLHVAFISNKIINFFNIKNIDIKSFIKGCVLHDFYLYNINDLEHKWTHASSHGDVAFNNAKKIFKLNCIEENMIRSHMWPFSFFNIPLYKESFILGISDKICAIQEKILNTIILFSR